MVGRTVDASPAVQWSRAETVENESCCRTPHRPSRHFTVIDTVNKRIVSKSFTVNQLSIEQIKRTTKTSTCMSIQYSGGLRIFHFGSYSSESMGTGDTCSKLVLSLHEKSGRCPQKLKQFADIAYLLFLITDHSVSQRRGAKRNFPGLSPQTHAWCTTVHVAPVRMIWKSSLYVLLYRNYVTLLANVLK